ncbi:uncharacterized protein LOC128558356 [Mercenaria mercenaria]|uniref:uncharacterized protein LOC128558356 n=1 Tax=Mercenaria mercenaria TaxID=6596 RepID=UPI00234EE033|nr:uncharacterized protein LOC128558356 [Mercenaria mercenaria]
MKHLFSNRRYNFKSQTIGDSFQRTVVTEELYISNYDYDTSGTSDVIAPGRITDLEINNIETATTQYGENRNFTITWTATEDDKNSGKATSYEMKISNNSFYLRDSFESAEALNMTNVTLSPQAVGSTEALKIVVDAEESFTETMYFAVRAVDEAGNVGPVSNIVPIVIARGFRASGEQGYAVTDTDDDIVIEDISPSKTSDEYDVKSIIVGVSVAGAVLLLAAGAFLYVKKSVTTKAAVTDSQLSICTNNHSMTDVEPFNPNQNEKTSTNSSPVLQTIEFPSPFTPSQIKELNTQDFTRPQTPDSDHRYIDTKLETKGTDETVVDIEDETSEFGDPDDYITETTTFTFPVCKVPFHMTNKAFPLKTSTEQEGVKKYHTVDDMSDQNVSERNHSTLPALPFATHENMDRSHPPPNMALHIFKPDAYGPGKKPYSFPAPFSGVSSTLDMSATMIADLETTDDILDNKDIQTADNEIVSGTTDREMHKYRIDINESKNEYLSCYNDNGMPDSVETGSSVTEHSACNDVHTDVCSRDDEVNCESKKSSESEIDETSFYNKEYTKKIEGSLYAGNFEVGSNNASYTEENEVIFRNEAYSVEDVISSRNANTENMEVKAEIECNGRKVGIDSDNES